MNEAGKGKAVCVTGASGYIASWLVKLLLQRGYTVNATIRDPNDAKKTEHLVGLEGAKERLHLFKADLMEEGSFDSAISGCQGVFHTASPVIVDVEDPQTDIFDPAVKGTLNILSSCKKYQSVRRVVFTSSVAAVMYSSRSLGLDVVIDESWFSDPEFCKESKLWYVIAKTLAEDAAWKFSKENSIDMVSINPGLVIGPMLQPTLNQTVALILKLINGEKTHPNGSFTWVHVKDVATAHILAFEIPSANGRYCIVESVAHHSKVAKMLRELYPTLAIESADDDEFVTPTYSFSKAKSRSLGIEYIPLKVSLMETVESLKEKGFVYDV